MTMTLPYNFMPREYQRPLFKAMDAGFKRAVCVWHRRSGKDKSLMNLVAKKMFERKGAYYYFYPTYKQGKKALWNGMDREGFKFIDHIPKELRKRIDNTDMIIETVNGSLFQVIGTDNIDSIVGSNPVGCVFSEYALQDPRAWDYMSPIVLENDGFAIFNYTPRGDNHGKELHDMAVNNPDKWFVQVLTVEDTKRPDGTPVITPEMIDQERKEGKTEEFIQQEYYCSFQSAVPGAYYGAQMRYLEQNNRIIKNLWEPNLPVYTYWDLGIDDSMSIVFVQIVGREIRFIDYEEGSGEGLAYYANKLKERPYTYAETNFPHDGDVKELGTGKSRKEVAESLGLRPVVIVKRPENKQDAIEVVRGILPKVYIDADKCTRLIQCLKNFSKEWDEKNKLWRHRHDWSSHGADAVQTFALSYQESTGQKIKFTETKDKWGRSVVK